MVGFRSLQALAGVAAVLAVALLSVWWGGPEGDSPQVATSTPRSSEQTSAPQAAPVESGEPTPTTAGPDADFDYYVLVLSWSPTHCASDRGRGADDDEQCRSGRPFGFVLHGLWPQNERGYPQNCRSEEPRALNPAIIARMMDFSPSEQLLQHEWEKHGACSGLSQRGYFAAAELAFTSVTIPSAYEHLDHVVRTTPDDVRDDFLKANRNLKPESIAATCSRNDFGEVWICLDRKLAPRACTAEVAKRHCGAREVRMRAVRGDWPK